MKSCIGCKYANWKRTAAGRLHPSGDGKCEYPYNVPPLPRSMYWMGFTAPCPSGGWISRRDPAVVCYYFRKEEAIP